MGDSMGNKRREKTRYIAKDRLRRVSNHLTDAGVLLGEMHLTYKEHHPEYGKAFELIIKMITMVEAMVIDIRDKL